MIVSRAEVLRIAALAKLRLSEAEAEQMARELASILGHMEALSAAGELAGSGPEEARTPAPQRRDEVAPQLLSAPITQMSDHVDSGFFTVPRLIG